MNTHLFTQKQIPIVCLCLCLCLTHPHLSQSLCHCLSVSLVSLCLCLLTWYDVIMQCILFPQLKLQRNCSKPHSYKYDVPVVQKYYDSKNISILINSKCWEHVASEVQFSCRSLIYAVNLGAVLFFVFCFFLVNISV